MVRFKYDTIRISLLRTPFKLWTNVFGLCNKQVTTFNDMIVKSKEEEKSYPNREEVV